ncbi:MAG: hypothetical protein HC831_28340 [Chloroflexia bacterium]|nr:hypothetical protein [Chloroflexia bacterium]
MRKRAFLKKNLVSDIEGISKFEQLSVAKLENDITDEEENVLAELLENSSQKQYEHQLMQKSKLEPDINIVFPNKNYLKHYKLAANRKVIYLVGSIAATAALLVTFFVSNTDSDNYNGLAINNNNFEKPSLRQPFIKTETKETVNISFEYAKVADNNEVDTTVFVERVNELVAEIDTRRVEELAGGYNSLPVSSSQLNEITVNMIDEDLQEAKVEDYVNATLQQLGVKQTEKEKSVLAKAGQSVLQSANKFIKKRFQVKKVEIEDGRKLYAVRAGSLEFYTNLKGKKNKEKKPK